MWVVERAEVSTPPSKSRTNTTRKILSSKSLYSIYPADLLSTASETSEIFLCSRLEAIRLRTLRPKSTARSVVCDTIMTFLPGFRPRNQAGVKIYSQAATYHDAGWYVHTDTVFTPTLAPTSISMSASMRWMLGQPL